MDDRTQDQQFPMSKWVRSVDQTPSLLVLNTGYIEVGWVFLALFLVYTLVLESSYISFLKAETEYFTYYSWLPAKSSIAIIVPSSFIRLIYIKLNNEANYIDIFTVIVFILRLGIEGISWISAYFPLLSLMICKFISDVVVGSFCCFWTKTIDNGHLVIYKLLRLCCSCWSTKWKLRRSRLFTFLHFTETRIDLGIRKFDKILVVIDFFHLLFLWLYLCHIIIM
jgi:hypothetical protein